MSFFSQIGDFASNLLAQVEEADEYYKGPTSGQMQVTPSVYPSSIVRDFGLLAGWCYGFN
eukprot:1337085-Amorphochlora_amoeboformis.AAC.1